MERNKTNLVRFAVLAALTSVRAGATEITIDDTLGATPGSIVPTGNTYEIPLSRGFVKETNLFHSFGVFNVDAGDIANFTGDDQIPITNIISRVTGGDESSIDGTVKSGIKGANFWFVNPAGVRIGENAYFNVSGSLAIGAADFVDFGGDLQWYAIKDGGTDVSSLSVDPQAFGFFENSDAGALHANGWRLIQVDDLSTGNVWNEERKLKVPNVKGLEDVVLAGGSGVYISNSAIQTYATPKSTRPPGSISIVSNSGDIELTQTFIGALTKAPFAHAPAEIRIEAQNGAVTLDTVRVRGATYGAADAANVTIFGKDVLLRGPQFQEDVYEQDSGACGQAACFTRVQTQTFGKSNAGIIKITGTNSVVTNEVDGNFDDTLDVVQITAAARGSRIPDPGAAGQIFVSAGTESDGEESKAAIRLNKTQVSVTHGAPKGGCEEKTCAAVIRIESNGELTIKHDSEVSGETKGPPNAAQIFLIGSTVDLSDGVTVSSLSDKGQTGSAGTVRIIGEQVSMADADIKATTGSNVAGNTGGSIRIGTTGSSVALTRTGVAVSTSGASDAGNVTLTGTSIALNERTEINAQTSGTGAAGKITITGGQVTSDAGSACTVTFGCAVNIFSQSKGSPETGPAGDVTITGDQIRLADAQILATTESKLATSPGGDIFVGEGDDSIELTDTIVQASTSGASDAGSVTLTGSKIVLVATTASKLASTKVSARTAAAGDAGNVTITGAEVRTSIGAAGAQVEISSLSSAKHGGSAGSVTITGNEIQLADTLVTASTVSDIAENKPGNIRIGEAGDEIELINTKITTTSGLSRGQKQKPPVLVPEARANAGDITLEGTTVTLREGTSLNAQTYALGDAGDITINGDVVTSTGGDDGVTISSRSDDRVSDLSGERQTGSAGSVIIIGNEIRLANTDISATTTSKLANDTVGDVRIGAAGGSVELTGTSVAVSTSGASNAGRIRLKGSSIALNDGTAIAAQTVGGGKAGAIIITGGVVTSTAGDDGNRVTISSLSDKGQTGSAGSVTIIGSDIQLADADISATTESNIAGNTGSSIRIGMTGSSVGLTGTTVEVSTSGASDAGKIRLKGSSIALNDGTTIQAQTFGGGAAGNIDIGAAGSSLELTGTTVAVSTSGESDAGNVTMSGSSIALNAGTAITAQTSARGAAGSIEIAGGVVTSMADADGYGVTISSTSGEGGTGAAGSISLSGTSVRLVGADISATTASTNSDSSAGNVNVTAARAFSLDDTTISSTSEGAGNGGNITLTFDGASTSGNAGIFKIKGTTISTNAEATEGGSITINAGGHEMRIVDGSEIKASAGKDGDGGDVLIDQPGQTIVQRSKILAKADNGDGGSIGIFPITGALFIQDTESEISADSGVEGQDGDVEIASPDVDLSAAIQPQDVEVARPPELSASACSPSSDTSPSTFVREGRGGVVPGPDGYLTRRPDSQPNRETRNGNALPSAEPHKLVARATTLTREDGPIAHQCM